MLTVKQIERYWDRKAYYRLFDELVAVRPEGLYRPETHAKPSILAAAMALVRLDELEQTHVALYSKLLCAVLGAQDGDGGWGDPAVTALCIRALQCSNGQGIAITRGLKHLAEVQRPEGIWPAIPLRRMPADAHVSAFVLAELGDNADFRQSVRFADAVSWFETHGDELDEQTTRLWERAAARCRVTRASASVCPC